MLENAAESPASGARFVGQPACLPERWLFRCHKPNRLNELGNEHFFKRLFHVYSYHQCNRSHDFQAMQ
jgi:hypothetical protein